MAIDKVCRLLLPRFDGQTPTNDAASVLRESIENGTLSVKSSGGGTAVIDEVLNKTVEQAMNVLTSNAFFYGACWTGMPGSLTTWETINGRR